MSQLYDSLDGQRRPVSDGSPATADFDLCLTGVVERGNGVASGHKSDRRYPLGTLPKQYPHFLKLGVDMGSYFVGTLNVSIAPSEFVIHQPWKRLRQVKWAEACAPEDFSLGRCCVSNGTITVCGLLYQPDPKTKVENFDDPSHLQIVAPFLPDTDYGARVTVFLHSSEVEIIEP